MSDLLIQNCDVLQLHRDRVSILRQQDVLIKGNKIQAVQPTGKATAREVIDATGLLLMPGLVNTHAHVPMVIFRGLAEDVNIDRWFNDFMWPLESNLRPEDVYWGMKLGLAEMIRAGVTTVADHYFYMDQAARAIDEAGTRALLGWAVFGSGGKEAVELSKRFVGDFEGAADGRIRTILAPHAPYTCDDDFLKAIVKQAERLNVGIHIHAAETMQQTEMSVQRRGITPIQVLEKTGILNHPTIIAHGCGITPADIDVLRGRAVGVAHAPKTYLKLAMDMTPILDLRSAGVMVGLASDGAVSNNTLDLWESLRLMAMMQKDRAENPEAMTISEALYIAFRESADIIKMASPHMRDNFGAVEAGYLADVILVDLSGIHHQPLHSATTSLVYNMQTPDVRTVIIDGKIVMRDRRLLTLDEREIVTEVKNSMARLAHLQPDKRIQVYNP